MIILHLESNPGHAGRPGLVGGSAPGKGITRQDVLSVMPFLVRWKNSERAIDIPENIQKVLEKFNIEEPKTLYKGGKLPYDLSLKLGQDALEEFPKSNSWTENRQVAETFMVTNGWMGKLNDNQITGYGNDSNVRAVVISRTFSPKETFFSFDKYFKEADRLGVDKGNFPAFGSEGEIISRPGKYNSKVVTYLHGGYLKRDTGQYNWYKGEIPRWYTEQEPE